MSVPVLAPACYVPAMAVSFTTNGSATSVDADHPLPVSERAYRGAVEIVPGTEDTPGRGVAITCTTMGTVAFLLADGSTLSVPIDTGFTVLPLAARTVNPAGTTAIATYANLV